MIHSDFKAQIGDSISASTLRKLDVFHDIIVIKYQSTGHEFVQIKKKKKKTPKLIGI